MSLKIIMYHRKTLFQCIPKYFKIQNSSFLENAKTKVYALEDSLGVYVYQISFNYLKGYMSYFPLIKFIQGRQL